MIRDEEAFAERGKLPVGAVLDPQRVAQVLLLAGQKVIELECQAV